MQIALWVTCEATPQKTFRGRASPSDIPTFKASRFQSFPAVEKIRRCEAAGSREQHGAGKNVQNSTDTDDTGKTFSIPKPTEAFRSSSSFLPDGYGTPVEMTSAGQLERNSRWNQPPGPAERQDLHPAPRGWCNAAAPFRRLQARAEGLRWLKASWKQVESLKWHEVTRSGHLSTAGIIVLYSYYRPNVRLGRTFLRQCFALSIPRKEHRTSLWSSTRWPSETGTGISQSLFEGAFCDHIISYPLVN